jgi:hypothetical protein
MSSEAKAIVLLELNQKHFLEQHICDPGQYFPVLKQKDILSQAECSWIKKQRCVEYQVQRLVELISLKNDGYDVFMKALRRQNAHVATQLKRRVSEVDELCANGLGE